MPILFSDVTVVPMDGAPQVLEHAYVAVEGTKIASVGTEPPEGTFDRVVDGAGKVLLPGFVNAHTHLPMTLMRGYGGGCDLHTWLNQYIFPAEARLDSRAVAAGAGLGLAVPHGGCKNSGIGKDGSRYSLEEYTYIKGIRMAIS